MSSFGVLNRQTRDIAALFAVVLATIMSAFVPALVSAAQITSRSIELSSSTMSAPNVSYKVTFTASQAADAFLVDFCKNSPLIGESCTTPDALDVTGAASTTSGVTNVTGTGHQIVVTVPVTAGVNTVEITGIKNPSYVGSLFARVLTFDSANLGHYQSDNPDNSGANPYKDSGGVAMSITNTVGVSAAVLESMTFCVSGSDITGTGCSVGVTPPTLSLGETTGTVKALSSTAVSTGDLYTQLSTNAASGVTVNLKSSNSCGGLKRVDASGCDIAPALQTNITQGQAKVGVIVAPYTANDTSLGASGTFQAVSGSGYNDTTYALNYNGTTDGVSSVYGDPILDTNSTQPNNKEMKLTFGASAANNTPAGLYTNNYSLIATGKF